MRKLGLTGGIGSGKSTVATLFTRHGTRTRPIGAAMGQVSAAFGEAIVHPLLQGEISRQAQLAQQNGARCTVFDIPLLMESGHWRKILEQILVVDCTAATQIARVMQCDRLSAIEVQLILDSQASRTSRLRIADIVLTNDGISREHLASQVRQIAAEFGL